MTFPPAAQIHDISRQVWVRAEVSSCSRKIEHKASGGGRGVTLVIPVHAPLVGGYEALGCVHEGNCIMY